MAPDQLSEVELMKIFAEFQWVQLGDALECPSHLLVSEEGDRLYASVVQVESRFGPDGSISQFQEGDVVHARGHVQFYAKQFLEGWAVLGKEPVARDAVAAIKTKADLEQLPAPWICMTNAIVARVADNTRLKTFQPAATEHVVVPTAPAKPLGLIEHERVMHGRAIEPVCETEGLVALKALDESPILYTITTENDLNGAGLLYFARYIAMMNYAERITLTTRMRRPFSLQLYRCLSTSHRRSYFFANASETDRVQVYCKAAAIEPGRAPRRSGLHTEMLRLVFEFELHRESDGMLMAKSIVSKTLTVPTKFKSLLGEAARLIALIGD